MSGGLAISDDVLILISIISFILAVVIFISKASAANLVVLKFRNFVMVGAIIVLIVGLNRPDPATKWFFIVVAGYFHSAALGGIMIPWNRTFLQNLAAVIILYGSIYLGAFVAVNIMIGISAIIAGIAGFLLVTTYEDKIRVFQATFWNILVLIFMGVGVISLLLVL